MAMIRMRAPTGEEAEVDSSEVEHFRSLGAVPVLAGANPTPGRSKAAIKQKRAQIMAGKAKAEA